MGLVVDGEDVLGVEEEGDSAVEVASEDEVGGGNGMLVYSLHSMAFCWYWA